MGFNDISHNFGHGVGKFVGTTRKVLSWPGSTLSKAIEKLRSVFSSAKVRTIVTEELTRLMGAEGLAEEKLEQRFKVMAELGGGKITRVDEPLFAGSNGALKMAKQMPRHFWQMLA